MCGLTGWIWDTQKKDYLEVNNKETWLQQNALEISPTPTQKVGKLNHLYTVDLEILSTALFFVSIVQVGEIFWEKKLL